MNIRMYCGNHSRYEKIKTLSFTTHSIVMYSYTDCTKVISLQQIQDSLQIEKEIIDMNRGIH